MISPSLKLYRLRGIFVAYYVLKSIVGAFVAFGVLKPLAGRYGLHGWSPGSLAVFIVMVTAMVLAVALLIFARLLERKNWARLLLLIFGWLAVFSACFGLLLTAEFSGTNSWLVRLLPGLNMDWKQLLAYDRIEKVFELIFWGYLVAVLQFDADVRKEFIPSVSTENPSEK